MSYKYFQMPETASKTLCHDIHSSLLVEWTNHGWKMRPCCLVPPQVRTALSDVGQDRKDWFSGLWPQMRRDNLAGQPLDPKSCSYCINDEKIGKQSRRTGEIIRRGNVASPSVGPKYIEITMEYTCNNACMICSQARSSLWKKYTDVDQREDLTHAVDQDVYQLLENLDLSQLDHITIMGGEPLLTDRHVTLLRTLERRGVDLGKIELWYNTNGTCRVERTVSLLNAHRLTFVDQWVRDDFPFNGFDQAVEVQTHVAFGVMGLGHISAPHLEFLKSMPESYALLNRMYPMSDIQQTDQDNGRVLSHVDTQDQRRDVAIGSYFPEFRSFYL